MKPRFFVSGMLAAATVATAVAPANALEIARVTRRGYIVVDEPEAVTPYEGRVPTGNTQDTFQFIADLTRVIADTPGAPRGRYVAVMQTSNDSGGALAFYLGLFNDVRGIGQTSPVNRNQETYNLNSFAGTAYPVTGFVWLNNYNLYIGGFSDFGKYLICTQEFGHRWGTFVRTPPQPTGNMFVRDSGVDTGVPTDASAEDGSSPDASDADADGSGMDASVTDSGVQMGPALTVNGLLGRQTAHWSYFVHSNGSPMEGNNWSEIMPGVFRAGRPTFKFHPMDLYIMGMLAPEDVPSTYIIANPDTMGQRDRNGQRINPASTPEFGDRNITIRGTRVPFGMEDIIRANGPRIPAAVTVTPTRGDGGVGSDAGADGGAPDPRPSDLDVVWVLLTTSDRVGDRLVRDFDRAVDECADGYSYSTDGRSELIPQVTTTRIVPDVVTPDATAPDAGDGGIAADAGDGGSEPTSFTVGGGCACRATVASPAGGRANGWALCAALSLLVCVSARARRRARA